MQNHRNLLLVLISERLSSILMTALVAGLAALNPLVLPTLSLRYGRFERIADVED